MITAIIQIGNSDHKLTQCDWSEFVTGVAEDIKWCAHTIRFSGGAAFDSQYQNACWVIELREKEVKTLKHYLQQHKLNHNQDSIAFTVGKTELI